MSSSDTAPEDPPPVLDEVRATTVPPSDATSHSGGDQAHGSLGPMLLPPADATAANGPPDAVHPAAAEAQLDAEWIPVTRSRKRARADTIADNQDVPERRVAAHPGPLLALAAGAPSAHEGDPAPPGTDARAHPLNFAIPNRALSPAIRQSNTLSAVTPTPRLLGRHMSRGSKAAHPLGTLRRLAMSPLEDGQIREVGLGTTIASRTSLAGRTNSLQSFTTQATAGSSAGVSPMTPRGPTWSSNGGDLMARRNATPGPSNHLSPTLQSPFNTPPAARRPQAPVQPLIPAEPDDILPQLANRGTMVPQQANDLPPLLRMQMVDFLEDLNERVCDHLVGAIDFGLVPLPTFVDNYPNGFWPEARAWIDSNLWLMAEDVPDLVDLGEPAVGVVDQVMDDAMAPILNIEAPAPIFAAPAPIAAAPAQMVAAPALGIVAPGPLGPLAPPAVAQQGAAVAPGPVIDIQNLIVLPNAVANGGRLTNRPFPLPRPHLHGAAAIQPPFDLAMTSEPDEGFPRIRFDDPEGPYAGWDAERIRHFSRKDPATTVLATLHPPKTIQVGGGWPLAKEVRDFFEKLCRTREVNVVPIDVQDPPPRLRADDVHSRPPVTFGVSDIPAGIAPSLIAQQTFSIHGFTIHFFSNQLRFDDYVGRIEGFTQPNKDAITAFVVERFNSDEVRAIIRKYVARNPFRNMDPPDIATQKIINSLRVIVDFSPQSEQPIARLYIDSPTDGIDAFRAWRKELKTVRWKSLDHGTGLLVYLPPCNGCTSVEHRVADCPFPDILGWLGPSHEEIARTSGIRMGGRGRGGAVMGRGRGRGFARG